MNEWFEECALPPRALPRCAMWQGARHTAAARTRSCPISAAIAPVNGSPQLGFVMVCHGPTWSRPLPTNEPTKGADRSRRVPSLPAGRADVSRSSPRADTSACAPESQVPRAFIPLPSPLPEGWNRGGRSAPAVEPFRDPKPLPVLASRGDTRGMSTYPAGAPAT
jgi:hypothetical protein